jgi:hypothetical protein
MPIQGYRLRRPGSVGSSSRRKHGFPARNTPPRRNLVTCAFVVVGFCSSTFKGSDP